MIMARRLLLLGLFLGFVSSSLMSQPKLIVSKPTSYLPGERIAPETWVLDSQMERVRLLDQVKPETRVVVLVLFGGGFKTQPEAPFRGTLWCQDSFDDLSIQRALVAEFAELPVEFVAVAVPPVFSAEKYGFREDVFLAQGEETSEFADALRVFVEATEKEIRSSLLPFDRVYYDPQARLTQTGKSADLGTGYGEVYPWQGKLKWHLDPRKYGAPTIWLLNSAGEVLGEPFWGNDYDSDPPEINYGFMELKEAVTAALEP
jgi:hypothetical protein